MFELKSTSRPIRRAILLGVFSNQCEHEHAESLLAELAELVETLGITILEKKLVKIPRFQSRFLLGSGKAEEMTELANSKKADVIIFDNAITPGQQRNWEKLANLAVIDREEVILDIFSRRARTREARLQVELAQMEYSLPRLTRAWGAFEQAGWFRLWRNGSW